MSCSMISRRRLRFCDLSRNSIAAQRRRRKRMRLMRWMMIGALMSAPPATMNHGLRNKLKKLGMAAHLRRGLQSHSMMQELREHGVEVVAGPGQLVVDAGPRA